MSPDIWIGAALSIPIGIGTGLAVAPIRRWYARRGESKQQAKRNRITREYTETLRYLRRPDILNQFYLCHLPAMLQNVLLLVMTMFVLVMITQNDFTKIAHDPHSRHWYLFLKVALDLDLFVGSFALSGFMWLGSEFVSVTRRVNSFQRYVKTVPSDIRRVEAEEAAYKEWRRD